LIEIVCVSTTVSVGSTLTPAVTYLWQPL